MLKNIGEHLYDLIVGKNSLNMIQVQTIRKRLINLTTFELGDSKFKIHHELGKNTTYKQGEDIYQSKADKKTLTQNMKKSQLPDRKEGRSDKPKKIFSITINQGT